jgi:hypothetical protein
MDSKDAMRLLLEDRKLFKETLMQIENKDRQLVPFKENPIQEAMNRDSTGRDIHVKPAQVGFSSDVICDFLIDCITIPGTTAVIISYDEFITGRLLRKAHSFHSVLQDRIPSVDRMHHKSTSEITFKKMRSSFYIGSARGFAFGRGERIDDLFADEFGFWQPEDTVKFMGAALQRVPLSPHSKVRIGSTANGEGNDFYEAYNSAKEGKNIGASVFTAHFYPWWMLPEYSMPYDSHFALPGDDRAILEDILPEEEVLLKRFEQLGVDDIAAHSKIRWRRYKIAEMSSLRRSGETRLLFQQEYPEDDVSCFLTAGDMVYDAQVITEMARNCYPAEFHTLFADIWCPPEAGESYLVAIDPGVGIKSESVATVWSFTETEFKHHATLSGYYKGDEMASKCKDLACYYNNAVIAAEDALEFVAHIKDYHNLYYRTDVISGRVGRAIGWATTPKTKPYMITEVGRHLEKVETHDIRIVSQLRNIRWVEGTRGERAVSIGADDYHDSLAIAVCCRETMPMVRGLVGVAGWSDDWGK